MKFSESTIRSSASSETSTSPFNAYNSYRFVQCKEAEYNTSYPA